MHARRIVAPVVTSALVVAALAGCGGGEFTRSYAPPSAVAFGGSAPASSGGGAVATAPASAEYAPSARYASASTPSAPSAAAGSGGYEPAPQTRPGLATEWGERRYDPLSYAGFVRGEGSPWASTTIHYNDLEGAATQAAYHANAFAPVMYTGGASFGDTGGVHVSLRDDNGSSLPGQIVGDALYVVGSHGQHYTISLVNQTPLRLEAVVSVDGLDVIDGHAADLGHRGYIIDPYGHIDIAGFRESESTIAAFRFGTVADSYAAQTGSARNVGVVGVALFTEAGAVIPSAMPPGELYLRETANPFPGGFAPPPPRRSYW